ncbi:uncharacterized protein LOC119453496 isoform X2 [Dermacentor silvarum]|uniref:uncharacterized protein LOC119453496 isoform X2 n=1 Tax=Dermacentor silvarum TaxID=543639 RepID=UPI002101127D|nr:uncharacterized protein LOC119453496 isoform X2 [Dermacentor silvarum]
MSKKICVVPLCPAKESDVPYHKFPRRSSPRRQRWIDFVRASGRGDTWTPRESSRICSRHFAPSCYKEHPARLAQLGISTKGLFLEPGALPTVYPGPPSSAGASVSAAPLAKRPRHECCSGMGCTPAVSMGHCGVEMVSKATTTAKLKVDATTQCAVLRIPKSTMASRVKLTSTTGMQTERITEEVGVAAQTELTSVGLQALETQCLALNEALYTARSENEQLQLSKAAFQGCEAKVIFYTGMPNFTQLNSLFEVLESHVSHNVNNSLSKFQEFILFLMKLKLNLHNVDLGFRFGVSEATVCRIFDKWLHCAYCRLKTQIVWPDRTALRRTMPQAFYDAFGDDVSVIIDCFELKIERPSSFLPRSETWSQYKGSNTAKFLIGIAPTGVVTFISEGWGGRTTDRHITEHCGLLDYLLPGDVVLADRGFNISESVGFYCARLHIPAFTRGKKQLSAEEVESTRKLANVRIHVERVIGLIRNKFAILKSTLPIDYVTCRPGDELAPIDKIVTVCCALSNLCPSIVAELKDANESP